ncbi:MAG: NAD-dependent epimerase/dehydratase family protein [Bacteroidales bacterium]
MQTILGAGGSIGTPLAKELTAFTGQIRLVSRNPKKINTSDELFPADLLDAEKVSKAVKGSDVVYLVAGLPYKIKVWQEMWPKVMRNTLDACIEHKSRLVFLDNIYLYDPDHIPHTTEETPVKPSSKKGRVRADIAQMLMNDVEAGKVNALIARAPDFYGPGIKNTLVNDAVFNPMKAGKKASWFASADKIHSFIWTPDAAKATAILGNDEKAFGQVWHLPTASDPMTGRQIIEFLASEMGIKPKFQLAGKTIISLLGIFNPVMKEFVEMLYQYDRDYVFDSSKFEKAYHFKPTPYREGLKMMIAASG